MITERVDDIPLIMAELQKSSLSELLNKHFPDHGNWQGLSGGQITSVFLSQVLSRNDHRLSPIEQWASERLHTLRYLVKDPKLEAHDFSDDRLGALADKYSKDDTWYDFETEYNQRLIQVYNLSTEEQAIRLDPMIVQSHRPVGGDFQLGFHKQHRPDLPQMKVMLAALDPFALPLYSLVVPGNTADDKLYIPAIDQLSNGLFNCGQLFVGDSKMGARAIRIHTHNKGHYYLTPLSLKQCSKAQIQAYLAQKPADDAELTIWSEQDKKGQTRIKAKAFEVSEIIEVDDTYCWKERRIMVYSPAYAKRQTTALNDRLAKAQADLDNIFIRKQGRKHPKSNAEAKQAVQKILSKHRVQGFIDVRIQSHEDTKTSRGYLGEPKKVKTKLSFSLKSAEIEQHKQLMGWRAYACNAPMQQLDTLQVVQCYRSQYKIEHKFDELLHRMTALMPIFLHKQNRIKALIRLLFLILKTSTLIEFKVREKLKATQQQLKELYPGNPNRATDRPTTKLLLKAFEYITLVIMPLEDKMIIKMTPLKLIQLKILELLEIPPEIYQGFNKFFFSYYDLHEI